MKPIAAAMITCIALFGISLGAAKYLMPAAPTEDTETELESSEATTEELPSEESDLVKSQSVPVSFRPETVSVEAIIQMSDSIRRTEQELIDRQTQVEKEEQRVRLLFSDLETEQEELKALSESVDEKIRVLERLSQTLATDLQSIETKQAELQALAKETNTDPDSQQEAMDDKVNQVRTWFEGLAPEQAANYLKEFSNNGKMEFAASLLQKMPDRQKSKILGAMEDPVLVDQLIDALSVRKK